jgi:hypothetical protein
MRHVLITTIVVLAVPFLAPAQNQATPDLSGTWTLHLAANASEREDSAASLKSIVVIARSGSIIEMKFKSADAEWASTRYIVDGKEHPIGDWQELTETTKRTSWIGSVLTTETTKRSTVNGREISHATERWILSSDGRTLTLQRSGVKTAFVFDKQ